MSEYKILVGKDSLTLAQLRNLRGVSQVEVAARMRISQSSVSKLEKRENPKISSVRRYVEALGGTVHTYMNTGNGRIPFRLNQE